MKNTSNVGKLPSKGTSCSKSNVPGCSPGGERSGCTWYQLGFWDHSVAFPQQPSLQPEEAVVLMKTSGKDCLRV